MLKDITLGQYFPGNSVLHRLDPRIKIVLMLFFVVFVFFANHLISFSYLVFVVAFLIAISKISFRVILKGLKPIVFISIFTALINLFWTNGENLLLDLHFVRIYEEGIWRAIFMIVRIVSLVCGTSILLTYTTTPMELTDALESLLNPLKKIRVPVHEFAMMMSLALRFVPTLIGETEKIINAQKARGTDFENGSLLKRARALMSILIPLLISSFSRANELAVAMECRCYTGGEGRTRMNQLKIKSFDWIMMIIFLFIFSGIIILTKIPFSVGAVL